MFTIYGQPNCGWCEKAKAFLTAHDYQYEYFDVSENLEEFRVLFPTARTVPQIMHDSNHIGGYEDLVEWHKQSMLK